MANQLPTQEELKNLLVYDRLTGRFRWRFSGKGRPASLEAGTVNNHGYIVIMIKYKRWLAHKLAWLYVHGEYPEFELDHIDGDSLNNRLENLRPCFHSDNLANSKTRSDNAVGQRGVCWDKQKGRWKVQIGPAGNRIQKHFDDIEEAKSFAQAAHRLVFGKFSRHTTQ